MRTLMNIIGVRWDDFVKSHDIKERLCQPLVSVKLRRARLKCFGHVERMVEKVQMKRVTNAEMEGRRLVGRPRTIWKDVIRWDMGNSGLS